MANRLVKPLLIAAGSVSVGIGVLGIFLPLLPTTPFLLMAAACYARSSPRLWRWLHENRWFGAYLRHYRAGQGMPRRAKWVTIALLWVTIAISMVLVDLWWVRVILAAVVIGVTIHVLRMKTLDLSGGEAKPMERDFSAEPQRARRAEGVQVGNGVARER